MNDENTPGDSAPPEQALQGAPGSLVQVPDAVYKIYSHLSGNKLVDMSLSGGSTERHNVKLYHDNSEPESTWSISRLGNGAYLIRNGKSPQLTLEHGTGHDVFASYDASPSVHASYHWLFKEAGGGYVYLENKYSGDVMDVKGSNTADNTDIIAWAYGGSANQKFRLVKVRNL